MKQKYDPHHQTRIAQAQRVIVEYNTTTKLQKIKKIGRAVWDRNNNKTTKAKGIAFFFFNKTTNNENRQQSP
jgi:hypothetical protein